jgi:hypothetical protein
MITILQLVALPDTNEITLGATDETGQKRMLEFQGVCPLLDNLDPHRFAHQKLVYGGEENPLDVNLTLNMVYNSIGQPERCSRTLKRAQDDAQRNPFPYINHPDNIPNVRPDILCGIVKNIKGIEMPHTVRFQPRSLNEVRQTLGEQGIRAPFIFKEPALGPQNSTLFLVDDTDGIDALERFAFDGRPFHASRFYDYCSADGLYRLYRFYVIGDTVLPGHLIVSDHWQIRNDEEAHRGTAQTENILKEEKEFLRHFRHKKFPALLTLQQRLGLDYFVLNCTFDAQGNIILFGIECEGHYSDGVKAAGYYGQKEIIRFNDAVASMIWAKRK